MRASLRLLPLLAFAFLTGCALSPGIDLPSGAPQGDFSDDKTGGGTNTGDGNGGNVFIPTGSGGTSSGCIALGGSNQGGSPSFAGSTSVDDDNSNEALGGQTASEDSVSAEAETCFPVFR